MLLCVIRPGAEYTVCVVPDGKPCSQSQVIAEINGLMPEQEQLNREVWATLYREIPVDGLPGINGQKPLRDDIRQFNFGRLPGIGFRVLWFEGEGPKEVICSGAFTKRQGQSTPDTAIDRAIWHRHQFVSALRKGKIKRQDMRPSEL